MDPREELSELIKRAKEYLLYYRELGLSSIGEKTEPVLTLTPPSLFISKPATTMTTKKEKPAPQATSLFGELSPPLLEDHDINETIEDIRHDLGDCRRCKLWSTRTKIVFGEGNPKAELMFVGEGPGADEDATGRPFVGRAGQLLTKMIEAIDMKREEVYIANVVKSRPPENRAPEKDEVEACIPFLFRQIAAIRPKLIVALGNPAMQALLDTKIGITKMRGEFQDYPRIRGIKVLPTFHPAYLLRSPDKKREAWDDLKKVRDFLRGEI
ncbi:MAG: uracil-DNA glycosylase [Acidobacteria bacterium]|nr:uracil-DNA glycosylase [Acidobacteriota bacterium]